MSIAINRIARVATLATLLATAAQAEVVLKSIDGTVSISGELLDVKDGTYVIDTELGMMAISMASVSCEGEQCPVDLVKMDETIRLVGSPVLVGNFLTQALDEYSLVQDADFVTEVSGGNGQKLILNKQGEMMVTADTLALEPAEAFDALLNGQADMIMTTRRATNFEIDAFIDRGLGDITTPEAEFIVAQDALVVVASRDNPVRALSADMLDGIFSGRITNWSQVGGPNQPITVYAPEPQTAEYQAFYTQVLEPNFSEYGLSVNLVQNVDRSVASDPSAIGLQSSALTLSTKPLAVSASCGMVSETNSFSIKSEDYPYARRLYAYNLPGKRSEHMQNIIELMASQPDSATGIVSLTTISSDLNAAGKRIGYALTDPAQSAEIGNLQRFVREVLYAERLSTTFRFGSGSSQLDNKARADAARLAELLREPQYAGREVLLVGFTDSIGRSDVNVLLSQRRAQQVVDEMVASGIELAEDRIVQIMGFGAASPVACNTEDTGRDLNRRVEVWLR